MIHPRNFPLGTKARAKTLVQSEGKRLFRTLHANMSTKPAGMERLLAVGLPTAMVVGGWVCNIHAIKYFPLLVSILTGVLRSTERGNFLKTKKVQFFEPQNYSIFLNL